MRESGDLRSTQKKSGIVVFGLPKKNFSLKLGEHEVDTVEFYKYLGIELTRTLNFKLYTERILEKASRNMQRVLAMGVAGGFLGHKLAETVWKSLVRSVLEFGCEVWGLCPPKFREIADTNGTKTFEMRLTDK
jgi:hypothetical protein